MTEPRFKDDDFFEHGLPVRWTFAKSVDPMSQRCPPIVRLKMDEEVAARAGLIATTNAMFVSTIAIAFRGALLAQVKDQLKAEASAEAFETLQRVVSTTTEVFGDCVLIKESVDPEYPDEKYVVLSPLVSAVANVPDLESDWVRRIAKIAPSWFRLRLRVKRKK